MDMTNQTILKATPLQPLLKRLSRNKLLFTLSCLRQALTGDIIKYDQQRQQIIVKNFAKNVTRIIRISDIQRLRFVPSTVQTAQKNRFKKE